MPAFGFKVCLENTTPEVLTELSNKVIRNKGSLDLDIEIAEGLGYKVYGDKDRLTPRVCGNGILHRQKRSLPPFTRTFEGAKSLLGDNWLIWEMSDIQYDGLPGVEIVLTPTRHSVIRSGGWSMVECLASAALLGAARRFE